MVLSKPDVKLDEALPGPALAWFELETERATTDDARLAAEIMHKQGALEKQLIDARSDGDAASAIEPFTPPPRKERAPSIAIVGAGIGGLCMGARLRMAGFEDIVIIDKASDVGGVWHYNKYPGIACDINTYLYQYSFFKNAAWTRSKPDGPEIQSYLSDFADHFDLRRNLGLNTEVTRCVHGPDGWDIHLAAGPALRADILISSIGFQHIPVLPAIEGMEQFQGPLVHSSTWHDGLDVDGMKVGVVGTGASGAQIIPSVVDRVASLTVFQRTPQWVLPDRIDSFPDSRIEMLKRYPQLLDSLYDFYLTMMADHLGTALVGNVELRGEIARKCKDYLASVKDESLRRKLTPDYPAMCKRIVMSENFYSAMQKPAVDLVTEGIARVEAQGIRTSDGVLHELDAIICATGFNAHHYCRDLNITVEGGRTLEDFWPEGAQTLDSVAIAGIPNFFLVSGPYSPNGNLAATVATELQVGFIIRLLQEMGERGAKSVAARPEAQRFFVDRMQRDAGATVWQSGCKSWYLDDRGKLDIWTRSPRDFINAMESGPDQGGYIFS